MTDAAPVLAAGAVCWRIVDGRAMVLVVHRAGHSDVSLPKGKVDPGETLPEAAAREVMEETGLALALGAPLGTVEYLLPNGRNKIVHYWSAEVDDHALELARFAPNDEIASLEWMSVSRAKRRLTYEHDADVIDRFAERMNSDTARTFALIVLRHGMAVSPEVWDGPDSSRPLLHRGADQAAGVARGIAAFGPAKIVSSTAARCLATVAPLAELTGQDVKSSSKISQDAYESGTSDVSPVVLRRLHKRRTAVVCSHGPVIPRIIECIAVSTGADPRPYLRAAGALATGEFAVFHLSLADGASSIVAVETHPAPRREFGDR